MPASTPPGAIYSRHYGPEEDLLSAGLGIAGLRRMQPPPCADPVAPSAAELRRRAIWSAWRGIADLRPGGAAGEQLPQIPGREFSALATAPGARHPHRVLLQLPDHFDPARPCLVVAPASGSRGIYGALAVAGPWALPRGCAVVYTDKAAGSDYVDLDSGLGAALDGRLGEGADRVFSPETAAVSGLAFKQAHSQDNPEADWGAQVRQAIAFGLQQLAECFPRHGLDAHRTRVIGLGISNGGGALLRAAESDDGLLDAVLVGAPNVYADAPGARPLYDYATLAALYLPCALAALDDLPDSEAMRALHRLGQQRGRALAARGLLPGRDAASRARAARALLEAEGFPESALRSGSLCLALDLWRSIAVAYASGYGRFAAGAHPCGFDYGIAPGPEALRQCLRATWWSDASGLPPGAGVVLHDPWQAQQDEDPALPGLLALRALWQGRGPQAARVQAGIAATRAARPRPDLPLIVLHGRDDGLILPAFSSRPYAAMLHAAGLALEYRELPGVQHFDALLSAPGARHPYRPLLPALHAALDGLWARWRMPD